MKEGIFIRTADSIDRFFGRLFMKPDYTIPSGNSSDEIFAIMSEEQKLGFSISVNDIRKNGSAGPLSELQCDWLKKKGLKLTYISRDEIIVDRYDYNRLELFEATHSE